MILPDSSRAVLTVHTSTPNLFIPDLATVSDSLSIPVQAGVIITDANLRVYIDHPSVGDLIIELLRSAPFNTATTLMDQPGTAGGSGGHIVPMISTVPILFDDQAASGVSAEAMGMGVAPNIPVGQGTSPDNYFPSPDSLAALNGQPVSGDWTLRVTDKVNGLSGQLFRWDLVLTQEIISPPIPEPATTTLTLLAGMGMVTFLIGRAGVMARRGSPRSG